MTATIPMSRKDIKKNDIITKVMNKELSGERASQLLKISLRQVWRLKKRLLNGGVAAIIHKGRGKPSNRRMSEEERNKIKDIITDKYSDFKPGFATEKLAEKHGIDRDPKTIRLLMIEAKLWKPRRAKNGSDHRQWRERKEQYGEMVQYDGSYHDWFEGRAPKACLVAAIDDANSRVHAKFELNEGTDATFHFWQEYLTKFGKPHSIYTDKFSTYSQNHKQAKENADALPQFARAIKELDITLILADSPQAKGRVERLFETLQDRLVKELRLNNISDLTEANTFLSDVFLPAFNKKYMAIAKRSGNLHKQLSKREITALPSILSKHYSRIVQNDFTISYKNVFYQIGNKQTVTVCKKDEVSIEEHFDGGSRSSYGVSSSTQQSSR